MAPLSPRLSLGVAVLLFFAAPTPAVSTGTALPRSLILSEGWLFQPDPHGVGDAQRWQRPDFDRSGWRPVTVPMAWDHFDPVMDGYEGVGWYALELAADRVAAGAWQRLRFGRANHRATVWIDTVKRGQMTRDVNAPGTLEPEYVRNITALTSGRVEALPIRPGVPVTTNTVLVVKLEFDKMPERVAASAGDANDIKKR